MAPRCHPVQSARSLANGGMDGPPSNRRQAPHPVQPPRSRVSGRMDAAANRSGPAVDNKGMEARDGFARPEGLVS